MCITLVPEVTETGLPLKAFSVTNALLDIFRLENFESFQTKWISICGKI